MNTNEFLDYLDEYTTSAVLGESLTELIYARRALAERRRVAALRSKSFSVAAGARERVAS